MRFRYYCVSFLCSIVAVGGFAVGQTEAQEQAATSIANPQVNLRTGSELADYVALPDENYHWELRERQTIQNCDVLRLHLTSQRWHGIDWRHTLTLIKPNHMDASREDAVLVISGGNWKKDWPDNGPKSMPASGEAQMMAAIANQFGCVVAVLSQVPFQPMMDGKHEDEIIATTFANYIETQDPTWPLLLPMVKSAVRGMDATSAAAQQHWGVALKQFTVTGASKRGWTTWLTGATDPRVAAIAPMVIDMLNMDAQMKLQVDSFGDYSEQIDDYTELNLPNMLSTPSGRVLQSIVDPFAYRKKLTLPKLLIFGTNDRYWPLDACNLYWDQLSGEKYLLYVPNEGHGIKDTARVFGSISAFHHSQHSGQPLPKIDWEFSQVDGGVTLDVTTRGSIDTVRGWVAVADTRDFRDARWEERACRSTGQGAWQLAAATPQQGFMACFAECISVADAMPAFFSTNVQIFSAQK